ncbi:hypothetical protein IAR55_005794 [Kwoniella newhampshirensis]|uniref:Mitochondrial distribution and morphology protein 12 n=1 Tax=Kwoniella newhampshirensis TaxID=1651941 RepID=A0AAW0YVM5_9TREE
MSLDVNWSLLSSPPTTPTPSSSSPSPSPSPAPTPSPFASSSTTATTDPTSPTDHTSTLAASLIETLNRQLATTHRPSFIGPITVTSFDFGSAGPDLEIRDIRDVWRVFDQGDEEGDELMVLAQQEEEEEEEEKRAKIELKQEQRRGGGGGGERYRPGGEEDDDDQGGLLDDGEKFELVEFITPTTDQFGNIITSGDGIDGVIHHDEMESDDVVDEEEVEGVMSSKRERGRKGYGSNNNDNNLTPIRPTVSRSTSNRSFIPFPFDHPAPTPHMPSTPGLNPSLFSHPRRASSLAPGQGYGQGQSQNRFRSTSGLVPPTSITGGRTTTYYAQNQHRSSQSHLHPNLQSLSNLRPRPNPQTRTQTRTQTFTHTASPPPSPPAHPAKLPSTSLSSSSSSSSSSMPSLQIHLHLAHTSDLHLTLLTSLQVNYPSQLFMALPLKISITGFQLDAEVVMAYNGDKNRLHLTIVDDDSSSSTTTTSTTTTTTNTAGLPGAASGPGREEKHLPIGQRLLPHLQIESEIGHSDAHVLRNVGKVERFIVDVVRKTLVDELVFPNFHTIAL